MLSNFGTFAKRLEELATGYLGVPSRAVVSGDIGLVLAIAALQLPRGSAVVLPSFTFNSTVNAILWNGLEPVFADISLGGFTLDPNSAADALADRNARAILVTHVFGNPADVNTLQGLADSTGARLIYDAAHAYGARHGGRAIGGFGDAEIFSLSGTKLITSAEGGIISSKNEELLARIDYLRAYGFRNNYNSLFVGLNGKMSELHAALGTLTLPEVESAVEKRHVIVGRYREGLVGSDVDFQHVDSADRSTYKDLALLFKDHFTRDRVEHALGEANVQTKRYFLPCHMQTAYASLPQVPLRNTEDVYSRILCIPIFAGITTDQIDHVVHTTKAALA